MSVYYRKQLGPLSEWQVLRNLEPDPALERSAEATTPQSSWVATCRDEETADMLIKALERYETGALVIVWSVTDILDAHPHLTREQAIEVLEAVERGHDASIGVNWTVIDTHVSMMYSPSPDDPEELSGDGPT